MNSGLDTMPLFLLDDLLNVISSKFFWSQFEISILFFAKHKYKCKLFRSNLTKSSNLKGNNKRSKIRFDQVYFICCYVNILEYVLYLKTDLTLHKNKSALKIEIIRLLILRPVLNFSVLTSRKQALLKFYFWQSLNFFD